MHAVRGERPTAGQLGFTWAKAEENTEAQRKVGLLKKALGWAYVLGKKKRVGKARRVTCLGSERERKEKVLSFLCFSKTCSNSNLV